MHIFTNPNFNFLRWRWHAVALSWVVILAGAGVMFTLDTETGGAAEALYRSMGYVAVGVIPGFALRSLGGLCSTTIFYRRIAP